MARGSVSLFVKDVAEAKTKVLSLPSDLHDGGAKAAKGVVARHSSPDNTVNLWFWGLVFTRIWHFGLAH